MNNSQVAHLWANQSQSKGKGSNFYFEGDTIYSYGNHFPIARIYSNDLIFKTSKSYSVSTTKHISIVNSAIDYTKYSFIEVPIFDFCKVKERDKERHEKNILYFTECFKDIHKKILKSRKHKEDLQKDFNKKVADYNLYCKIFRLKVDKKITVINNRKLEEEIKEEREAKKAQAEKYKQYEIEREANKLKENQERLNKFLNNDENICTLKYRNGTNFLKIVGEKCITEKGAEVLKTELEILVKAIKNTEDKTRFLNEKISNFTIDNFTDNGIKISCHFFDNEEINRIISLFKLG